MRYSDIKVGYIYNVIFDPVHHCEFNGKHLAVVLKKNIDKKTLIVMPFTSSPNGVGINKIKIGNINSLPSSLKTNDTYAVYNQVRTVNANRFIALKEGTSIKECKLDNTILYKLLSLGLREIVYGLQEDERIVLLKNLYENEAIRKATNLAYQVIKRRKSQTTNQNEITILLLRIKELIKNISYSLDANSLKDGIDSIFEEAKKI